MNFKSFNFHPDIQRAIPFDTPTPIQAQAIPAILAGKDIVASAETGSGKTAAFILPSLQQLVSKKGGHKPQILVLTPTRELAAQITQETNKLGKFLKLNIISLVGGVPYHQQLKNLSQNVDMVVATPGRLIDHMENGKIDLSDIKKLVLDEADRMLDMGFSDDVRKIAAKTPKQRQTLLFSATVDDSLKPMIKALLDQPERINLSHEKMAPKQIHQILYMADDHQHKKKLLEHLLANENIYKAIIFCETKRASNQLADELYVNGYAASSINGDLKQNVRNRRLEQFRRGKIQFLIATDVAARGIDVSDLTHVINYDIPRFTDSYVHRIGRTGRAGNEGTAISFALMNEGLQIKKIERYIGIHLKRATVEGLEPTQRENAHAPRNNKSKAKRFKNNKPAFSRQQNFKPRKAKRKTAD